MSDVFGLLGKTIDDKVRVDAPIGEGGFAVVYRGFHLGFEQPVAIKCLKIPAHFDAEAQLAFLARFQEEGKMLFRLSQHASIVRVFDLGEVVTDKGARVPYLVLEWLDGTDVDTLLSRRLADGLGPYTESEAIGMLRPAVDAIALAHRLGIAHRDLKPTNLMVAETVQGSVIKVLDFGIAKAMQEGETTAEKTTRTSSGFHAFSPQYGAPEQFRSKRYGATGPWTDIHALGLILVELVAGRPAMQGEEHADFYDQAVSDQRPTPRTCGVSVGDAFETLCRRCLARDPAERIQDGDELLAAMDAVEMGVRGLMEQSGKQALPFPRKPSVSSPAALAETAFAPEVPSLVPPEQTQQQPESIASPEREPVVQTNQSAAEATLAASSAVPAKPKVPWPWLAAVGAAGGVAVIIVGVLAWWVTAGAEADRGRKLGTMAGVTGGKFLMGSNEGAPDQRPQHEATVSDFQLDVTEVTVEAFSLCVEDGMCAPSDTVHLTGVTEAQEPAWNTFCNWGKAGRELHPMNCIDWAQAHAYCAWAGKRLPTESEWEYAARGGDENRPHPWGEKAPSNVLLNGCGVECSKMAVERGWKWKPLHADEDGWPSTSPVGTFSAGAGRWGHQDLAGNVWEWTSSRHCPYGTDKPEVCDKMPWVARGGGWASRYPGIFRVTFRAKFPTEYRAQDVGFRCAR